MMMWLSSSSLGSILDEDSIAKIMLYMDYNSMVNFVRCFEEDEGDEQKEKEVLAPRGGCGVVDKKIRHRSDIRSLGSEGGDCGRRSWTKIIIGDDEEQAPPSAAFQDVWKKAYHRHGFSAEDLVFLQHQVSVAAETEETQGDSDDYDYCAMLERHYVKGCNDRRRLLSNLMMTRQQQHKTKKEKEMTNVENCTTKKRADLASRLKKSTTRGGTCWSSGPPSSLVSGSSSSTSLSSSSSSCFNLPNGFFNFVPVVPSYFLKKGRDDNDIDNNNNGNQKNNAVDDVDDPPPVDYECDSFVLTSTGTSSELLFLNPFTAELVIRTSILDDVMCYSNNDENEDEATMMAHALMDAKENKKTTTTTTKSAARPTTDSFHNAVVDDVQSPSHRRRGRCRSRQLQPPPPQQQTLFDVASFFDVDLADYFYHNNNNGNDNDNDNSNGENRQFATNTEGRVQQLTRRTAGQGGDDDEDDHGVEVEIAYLGIDAKPIVNYGTVAANDDDNIVVECWPSLEITGTMVVMGRSLWNDPDSHHPSLRCIEVMAWFRRSLSEVDASYTSRHLCRVRGGFHTINLCAVSRLFYVNPTHNSDDHANNNNNNNNNEEDANAARSEGGATTIIAYPLLPYPTVADDIVTTKNKDRDPTTAYYEKNENRKKKYFPQPKFVLDTFGSRISDFAVSCTGDEIIAATVNLTLVVWTVATVTSRHQQQPTKNDNDDMMSSIRSPSTTRRYRRSNGAKTREASENMNASSSSSSTPRLFSSISIPTAIQDAFLQPQQQQRGRNGTGIGIGVGVNDGQDFLPATIPFAISGILPVYSMHIPKHLPTSMVGFITLHHDSTHGNILFLWQKPQLPQQRRKKSRFDSSNDNSIIRASADNGVKNCKERNSTASEMDYEVHAMINLPLVSRRIPQIHYDGRRLIIFGQDHIGYIILVYHVSHPTMEDVLNQDHQHDHDHDHNHKETWATRTVSASSISRSRAQEGSGGVYNRQRPSVAGVGGVDRNQDTTASRFSSPLSFCTVKFMNRIRHVALDGMSNFDSLHMTCNERFIIVNTKTGNLLDCGDGGDYDATTPNSSFSSSYSEGLLVIDLEDHYTDESPLD